MARRRTMNRRDLRDQADAAERLEADGADEAADEADAGEDEAPAKPKKKAAPKKPAPTKRTRTPKVVRMRAGWGVFDNSSKRVELFPYSQRAEAEAFVAEKMSGEKKQTFYIQLVKEPIEEAK